MNTIQGRSFSPCLSVLSMTDSLFGSRRFSEFSPCEGSSPAARPRRNRRPVRAAARMSQKCADLIGRFRRQDVLELASLLLDLGLAVHGQAISKEPLGQP